MYPLKQRLHLTFGGISNLMYFQGKTNSFSPYNVSFCGTSKYIFLKWWIFLFKMIKKYTKTQKCITFFIATPPVPKKSHLQ